VARSSRLLLRVALAQSVLIIQPYIHSAAPPDRLFCTLNPSWQALIDSSWT